MNLKNLKYPLYLFLVILIAKIGYVIVESFYNYHVLYTTTNAELSRVVVEELNINGHRISAIGITLLLLPLLYFIAKRLSKSAMIITLLVLSILSYIVSYQALNIIVEKIVEVNKEHRHDAYYVNIFKYGILNNIFAYDSFIENEKVQNNTLDVNDRILLTNSFLLLNADKELIDKLKERGKEKVAELYIKIELKEDYDEKYKSFKNASNEIATLWNQFNSQRKILNDEISKFENENLIKDSYDKFVNSLKQNYEKYQTSWNKINLTIREETKIYKINQIKEELEKYFRYQKYEKAQIQYKEQMIQKFGHFIEPLRWKDQNGKLTTQSIESVIIEEIKAKASKEMNNLPKDLSVKEFMYHDSTKLEVNKQLKKQDILIPYDFDYSYKQFKKYFQVMSSKKIAKAYASFYNELENKIGKNDLKLDMEWKDFIYSKFITSQIIKKVKDGDINNILRAIESKDLSNFKTLVYLPTVINQVHEMMYKEEDFKDGGKAVSHGDEAIKLLYIPPFALAVSIVALLLNLLTAIGLLLSLAPSSNKIKISIKMVVVFIILILPFLSHHQSFNNTMIQESTTKETKFYLSFLGWISYYEKLNSSLHQ